MAGRGALGVFDHLRSQHIICNDIATKRIDLEGVSLNGLMLQKILRESLKTSDASQISAAIAALAQQIETLTTEAAALQAQYTQISSQLSTVQDLLTSISSTVTSNDAYIQKLIAANNYFVDPPP